MLDNTGSKTIVNTWMIALLGILLFFGNNELKNEAEFKKAMTLRSIENSIARTVDPELLEKIITEREQKKLDEINTKLSNKANEMAWLIPTEWLQ